MNDPHKLEIVEAPKQRLFGTWSRLGGGALTFAILAHVVVLAIGGIWIFQVTHPPDKKNDPPVFNTGTRGPQATAQATTSSPVKPAPIIPASEAHKIISTDHNASLVSPVSNDSIGTGATVGSLPGGALPGMGSMVPGVRAGTSSGNSVRTREGSFLMLDLPFTKRCSKDDRLQRIKDNGGTPACEEAVIQGLRWLKAQQAADGSWGGSNQAATTGLALLAYFGHCETTASVEFGDSVQHGIVYLVNLGMKNHGRMASNFTANSWSYEHAIATYALAEAYTFCKQLNPEIPNLREVTAKAGQFIIDNQHEKGGWAYAYATKGGHADVSVAGWQIQALKACSHTGLDYRGMLPCIAKATKYLSSCQNANGGYGYAGPSSGAAEYFTLTGVGMLCNQMWGRSPADVHKAAKYVMANTRFDYNTRFCDLYGHYYESQAMMQRGGDDWKQYNTLFRDQLLNNQDSDGSWKVCGGGAKDLRAVAASYVGDKVYRTCLCTLMLEVYYRFLSTGGGSDQERSGI